MWTVVVRSWGHHVAKDVVVVVDLKRRQFLPSQKCVTSVYDQTSSNWSLSNLLLFHARVKAYTASIGVKVMVIFLLPMPKHPHSSALSSLSSVPLLSPFHHCYYYDHHPPCHPITIGNGPLPLPLSSITAITHCNNSIRKNEKKNWLERYKLLRINGSKFASITAAILFGTNL